MTSLFVGKKIVSSHFQCGAKVENPEKFHILNIQSAFKNCSPVEFLERCEQERERDKGMCPSHEMEEECSKKFRVEVAPKILTLRYENLSVKGLDISEEESVSFARKSF